jgi:hypothetical protein
MPRRKKVTLADLIPTRPSGHPCYDRSLVHLADAIARTRKEGSCQLGFHEALTFVFVMSQQAASQTTNPEDVAAVEAHARSEALVQIEMLRGEKPAANARGREHPEVM